MGNIAKNAFPVLNMHCAGCASNVEKTVKKLSGVVDASVNFAANTLTISYEDDKLTPGEIRAAVLAAGYDLIVEEANKEERREEEQHKRYLRLETESDRCVDICRAVAYLFDVINAYAIL